MTKAWLKTKEWLKRHKKSLGIIAFLLLFALLVIFGTQIYLWVNFHLGNDLIINLKAEPETLNLEHGMNQRVSFKSSITSNPFCKAECSARFRDISKDQILDTEQFTISTGSGFTKEYVIEPEIKGSGQKLYTFTIECRGKSNFLCHTSEEKVTRNILLTVNYDYSLYEKELQKDFINKISSSLIEFSRLKAEHKVLNSKLDELDSLIEPLNLIVQLKNAENDIIEVEKQFDSLLIAWRLQDYELISSESNELKSKLESANRKIKLAGDSMDYSISRYQKMMESFEQARAEIILLHKSFIINSEMAQLINQSTISFNKAFSLMEGSRELEQKELISREFLQNFIPTSSSILQNIKNLVLQREIENDLIKDLLCQISGNCLPHLTLTERANESIFLLNESCLEQDQLRLALRRLNASLSERYSNSTYPESLNFWHNLSLILNNLQQDLTLNYKSQIPAHFNNSALLNTILTPTSPSSVSELEGYNLTFALVQLLAKRNFYFCNEIKIQYPEITPVTVTNFTFFELNPVQLSFDFALPPHQCCALKKCHACCDIGNCRTDEQFYPIIFLHGHAFNKDVSTEYSLDAFNQIQNKLEEEGYINAGAVSLYTKSDLPAGLWGRVQSPLTLKSSYYYDAILKAENYILVQTKSENVDTYAVRLKEILDTVTYNTGRPKVIIVAHSMGGLVARRYLQIFGTEKVDKLIMFGTPNHGVTGDVANLCPVIGEDLECRDLTEGSVLLDKLNREALPKIPIFNFVGTGCDMGNVPGDGIVLESSAKLEGTENFIVQSRCSTFDNLHTGMLDIEKYPEIYRQLLMWLRR